MNRILFSFFSILLYSCTSSPLATMSIPVVEHKPIDDSVLFDAKRIVFLSSDSCMIGSISRIVLCDDRIYLLDTQTDAVWIYDMQGNHIGHIRAVGRAANEYINLMDFFVDRESKQIILYADPSKFLFYDYNLKPTRVMKAPALFYETVNSGEQIVCFNARTADPECCISVLAEKNGDPLKIKTSVPLAQQDYSDVFVSGRQLTKSKRINFSKRFDNSIYSVENGSVTLRYTIDFGKANLPDGLLQKKLQLQEFIDKVASKGYIYSIVNLKENDSHIYFNTSSPGLYRLSKTAFTVQHIPEITDSESGIRHSMMIATEDKNNEWICFCKNMMELKNEVDLDKGQQKNNPFVQKVNSCNESDNPVLFFYHLK